MCTCEVRTALDPGLRKPLSERWEEEGAHPAAHGPRRQPPPAKRKVRHDQSETWFDDATMRDRKQSPDVHTANTTYVGRFTLGPYNCDDSRGTRCARMTPVRTRACLPAGRRGGFTKRALLEITCRSAAALGHHRVRHTVPPA